MEIYEYAQLYLSLATFVAALTIIWYSRSRSTDADPETKKAFRPLYLFALALIVYAIGTYISFYEADTDRSILLALLRPYSPLWRPLYEPYTLYLFLVIEIIILSAAASMIMRQAFMLIAMIAIAAVCLWLLSSALNLVLAHRVSSQAEFFFQIGSFLRSIMLIGVSAIFLWIAFDFRRGTTLAMAFALLAQLLNLPDLYGGFQEVPWMLGGVNLPLVLILIILFITLMGPAMVAFTFLRPDQKVSFELAGYGASFAGPVLVVSGLQAQELTQDIVLTSFVLIGSIAIMLAAGTTSYLYGRWRESQQMPTFLMMLSFALFAFGQITGMLGNLENIPLAEATYIELLSVGLALTLFSITAIYAAGFRSVALIPMLLYIPVLILVLQGFPAPVEEVFLSVIWLVVPLMIVFFLPVFLFLNVWRRMRKSNSSGRFRPLGIAVGILIYLLIRVPIIVIGVLGVDPGYPLVTISFAVSWLALTGRLDSYFGTGQ